MYHLFKKKFLLDLRQNNQATLNIYSINQYITSADIYQVY